jgi:hypothetical protein
MFTKLKATSETTWSSGVVVGGVELGAGRHQRPKEIGRHAVVDENHVPPVGGEEKPRHARFAFVLRRDTRPIR